MPTFTISGGGPDIEPGVYPVLLTAIDGPREITAQTGPNAGSVVSIFEWTFAIDEPGDELDGVEIKGTTSTASGPRSKMFAWITALRGGVAPSVGERFESKDLLGKPALATIGRSDSGWPRIENLGALPRTRQAPTAAQPAAQPEPQRRPTARERVAAATEPF